MGDTLNIQTSEIETIKTSAVPQLTKREVEPVIVSSFESQANDEVFGEKREGRLFGASFVSTVFSTITSWSLTTTTAKATAKFAKETSVLSCLPAGYILLNVSLSLLLYCPDQSVSVQIFNLN